jgi:hypothetical protein
MNRAQSWTYRSIVLMLAIGPTSLIGGEPSDKPHKFTNRLVNSSSPYLLQHAHNPVDWYPWGEEAFKRARDEDKPILLSVGYSACHWCHVMERESFENETIAAVLNANFISIKVDREERPDIDEIYMAATQAMTGRGGWPMTVFMTPDAKPFECGTYFPPEDRGGRRGFRNLSAEIATKWQSATERATLIRAAGSLVGRVQARNQIRPAIGILQREAISQVIQRLASRFDPQLGGRRSNRNKFPPTMAMELMLREFVTNEDFTPIEYLDLVEVTLRQMRDGGIYDHIGGGICRYSTDPKWFAPHFEKMLYDQARVAGVYLSAYQLTRDPFYAEAARSILDYCIADLQDASGGFYSARDADSEGEEGKFYVWTRPQLEAVLGSEDTPLFCKYFNVTPRGNWHHGQNILHRTTTDEAFATSQNMTLDAWGKRLEKMRQKVFSARAGRVHPGLDDKILAEWNGMLIHTLARASAILQEPRYAESAMRAASFILEEMVVDGRLFRAHHHGKTHITACATDYTNVVEALTTLYETTFDRRWLTAANQLNDAFIQLFHDTAGGGFFFTAHDAESLIVRSKNTRDGVVPSANSTAALNLLRLAIHLRRPELRSLAEETLRTMSIMMSRGALERMQWAALFYYHPAKEIVIVGQPDEPATQALINKTYERYLPNKVVAVGTEADAVAADALPLLKKKKRVKGRPALYICQNYLCKKPETDPAVLKALLFDRLP